MTATTTAPAATEEKVPPGPGMRFVNGAANYIEDRTSISGLVKELGRKIFPDHWSFMLGEVALYSFIVILLSGTFLTFFFQASMAPVIYEGSYPTLKGVEMSAAMASTLDISFDIRGGLLMRQVHHWAALLFVASIGLHMLRVFFTGAYRKPREINWVVGFLLFVLALAEGFTGYSLPDDLLSGNGLRIIDGMVKGIPIVGTWISYLLFGGEFPGEAIVGRLYMLHIMLLPALVIAAHRRAHDPADREQAHPVRRSGTHRRQRRRLADHAGLRGEGRRILLHRLRRDHADRGDGDDQPDLELRPLRPLAGVRGNAARLVHRLRRRHAAPRSRRTSSP